MTYHQHRRMLDHPCLDAERAAIACEIYGEMAMALARGLSESNSHYAWFAEEAKRLEIHARDLRSHRAEASVPAAPAALRLVM